jgi:hypothetical protein
MKNVNHTSTVSFFSFKKNQRYTSLNIFFEKRYELCQGKRELQPRGTHAKIGQTRPKGKPKDTTGVETINGFRWEGSSPITPKITPTARGQHQMTATNNKQKTAGGQHLTKN